LEWSIPSPPPAWNYAFMPRVAGLDAYWSAKQRSRTTQGEAAQARAYETIEMPKNSPIGFVNAFFAALTRFALVRHLWWMAAVGLLGVFAAFLLFAFRSVEEVEIPAERIAQFERSHQAAEVAL